MKPIHLVVLLAVVGGGCGQLQQARFEHGSGSVEGRVVGSDGAPTRALVSYAPVGGRVVDQVWSSADGTFLFSPVAVGLYVLIAMDAQGQIARAETLVLSGQINRVGLLRLGPPQDGIPVIPGLLNERRVLSSDEVARALISQQGGDVLLQGLDPDELLLLEVDHTGEVGVERSLSLGFEPTCMDHTHLYGADRWDMVRAPLESPDQEERSGPFESLQDLDCSWATAQGLMCASSRPANLLMEDWMPGDLLLWRPGEATAAPLTDHGEDGMGHVVLSPDRSKVAYTEKQYNGPFPTEVVLLDLADAARERQAGDPVAGLAFAPDGALAVLHIDDLGAASIGLFGGSPLPLHPTNARRVERLVYDVSSAGWRVELWLTDSRQVGYLVSPDCDRAESSASADAPTDWVVASSGAVAYTEIVDEFRQLFVSGRSGAGQLTLLSADHEIVGWGAGGAALFHLTRDPVLGRQQLFVSRVEP